MPTNQQNSDINFSANLQDNVSPQADQIQKKLEQLGASPTEIKLFLRAYDEATPKAKQVQQQLNQIPKEKRVNVTADNQMAMQKLQEVQTFVQDPANTKMQVSVTSNAQEAADGVRGIFSKLKEDVDGLMGEFKQRIPIGFAGIHYGGAVGLAGVGALGAGAATLGVLQQSISINQSFEQSVNQLIVALKDQTEAQQQSNQIVQFAQKSGFGYPDLAQANLVLAQAGIPPGTIRGGALKSSGNIAAATATAPADAASAIVAARQGDFSQLSQYGVSVKPADFAAGGTFAGSTNQQALRSVLERFHGAMDVQSKTLEGIASNLKTTFQQQIIKPIGTQAFGMLGSAGGNLQQMFQSPQFQQKAGQVLQYITEKLTLVYDEIKKGKEYFDTYLKAPLEDIAKSVIRIGTVFAQTFGGVVLTGIKTIGEAFLSIVQPLTSLVASMPGLVQLVALFKALSVFGLSASISAPFKELGSALNPLHPSLLGVIESLGSILMLIPKISFVLLIKSIFDLITANKALNNSFGDVGNQGQAALDKLHLRLDAIGMTLGQTTAQMKEFAAETAAIVPPQVGAQRRAAVAYEAAKQYATLDVLGYGSGAQQLIQQQIQQKGVYTPDAVDQATNQFVRATKAISDALGIDLKGATEDLQQAFDLFGQTLAAHKDSSFSNVSTVAQFYGLLQKAPVTSHQLTAGYQNQQQLLQGGLEQYYSPSQAQTRRIMGSPGGLSGVYDFANLARQAQIPGSAQSQLSRAQHMLTQTQQDSTRRQQATVQMQQQASNIAGIPVSLPHTQNLDQQFGLIPNADKATSSVNALARTWVNLGQSVKTAATQLQDANQRVSDLQIQAGTLSTATDDVNNQMAQFQHRMTLVQRGIDDLTLTMNKYTFQALRPLQRQMTVLQNQMEVYQQQQIVPVQRAQEDWNQVMQQTTNHLSDVSFHLSQAQYNMDKFHSGLLNGEQAVLDNIHNLDLYNKQLQLLQLQNMGMMADISRSQFNQGYESIVKPLMGLSLADEMQRAQQAQQEAQLRDDLSYGQKHYRLDQASRTQFQRQEMSFSQRLQGIKGAVDVIDQMNLAQHRLQQVQYDQSLTARHLQNEMYDATVGLRKYQDQQFALNQQMYHVNQNLADMQDNITKQQLAFQGAQRGARKYEDALYNLGQQQYGVNKNLIEANQQVGFWGDTLSRQRDLMGQFGKTFHSMIGPQDLENLIKWGKETGFFSKRQLDLMKQFIPAQKEAADHTVSLWERAWLTVKEGFIGIFTGDTWTRIADVVSNGFGLLSRSLGFAPGPMGTALGIGASGMAMGVLLNTVRTMVGRVLFTGIGAGIGKIGTSLFPESTVMPKAASYLTTKASEYGKESFFLKPGDTMRNWFWSGLAGTAGTALTGNPMVGLMANLATNLFPTQDWKIFASLGKAANFLKDALGAFTAGLRGAEAGLEGAGGWFKDLGLAVGRFAGIVGKAAGETDVGSPVGKALLLGGSALQRLRGTEAGAAGAKGLSFVTDTGSLLRSMGTGSIATRAVSMFARVDEIMAPFMRFLGRLGTFGVFLSTALDAVSAIWGHGSAQKQGIGGLIGTGIGAAIGTALPIPGGTIIGAGIGGAAGAYAGTVDWAKVGKSISHEINKLPSQILSGIKSTLNFFASGKFAYDIGFAIGRALRAIGLLIAHFASSLASTIASGVSKAFTSVIRWIAGAGNAFITYLSSWFSGNFTRNIAALWQGVLTFLNTIISPKAWYDGLKWVANAAADAFSWFWNQILGFIKSGLLFIPNQVGNFFSGLMHGIGLQTGMEKVPYDNFPAVLHKDEAVLRADQATQWRSAKNNPLVGGTSSVSGGTQGSAIGISVIPDPNIGTAFGTIETLWRRHSNYIQALVKVHEDKTVQANDKANQHMNKSTKSYLDAILNHQHKYNQNSHQQQEQHAQQQQHTQHKANDQIQKLIQNSNDKMQKMMHNHYGKLKDTADTGYQRAHSVVKDWTGKINSQVDSTSGKLKGLNDQLQGLGQGALGSMGADQGIFQGMDPKKASETLAHLHSLAKEGKIPGGTAFQQIEAEFSAFLAAQGPGAERAAGKAGLFDIKHPGGSPILSLLILSKAQQEQKLQEILKRLQKRHHAGGLDKVPYDDYGAVLHQDEAVLNASEANEWRMRKRQGSTWTDTDYFDTPQRKQSYKDWQNLVQKNADLTDQSDKDSKEKLNQRDQQFKDTMNQRDQDHFNTLKDRYTTWQHNYEDDYTKHENNIQNILVQKQQRQQGSYNDGWSKINSLTSDWIGKVQKQIKGIDDNLGLTSGHSGSDGSGGGGGGHKNHASGGFIPGDKYDKRGTIIKVGEEGFDEMVIPLAPHRRDRAVELMKQTMGRIGSFAHGGTAGSTNPVLLTLRPSAFYVPGDKSHPFETYTGSLAKKAGYEVHDIDYLRGNLDSKGNANLWGEWQTVMNTAKQYKSAGRRVYAWGDSAGGTFASLLAEKGLARAAVANSPAYDLLKFKEQLPDVASHWKASDAVLQALSPDLHRSKNPILAYGGTKDWLIPYQGVKDWDANDPMVHSGIFDGGHLGVPHGTVYPTAANKTYTYLAQAGLKFLSKYAAGGAASHKTAHQRGHHSAGYVSPFLRSTNLGLSRIDMGVDYTGAGAIGAMGDAQILGVGSFGWPGTPGHSGVTYKLLDGNLAGKNIYVFEGVSTPGNIHARSRVKAGQEIARFVPGGSIETGWADAAGTGALAASPQGGGYTEGEITQEGLSFARFLRAVGAPTTSVGYQSRGSLYPGTRIMQVKGGSGITMGVSIPAPPKELLQRGPVGKRLYEAYQQKVKQWEHAANAASAASSKGGFIAGSSTGSTLAQMDAVLKHAGLNKTSEAAIMGNAFGESSWDPSVYSHDGGLFGFLVGEKSPAALQSYAQQHHVKPYDIATQVNFMLSTLPTSMRNAMNKLGLIPATDYFLNNWEGAAGQGVEQRHSGAQKAFSMGYAGGLSNVPYDNFPAMLHQDERVLSAAENQRLKSIGVNDPVVAALNSLNSKVSELVGEAKTNNRLSLQDLRQQMQDKIRKSLNAGETDQTSRFIKQLKNMEGVGGSAYTSNLIDNISSKYGPRLKKAEHRAHDAEHHYANLKHKLDKKDGDLSHHQKHMLQHAKHESKQARHHLAEQSRHIMNRLVHQGVNKKVIEEAFRNIFTKTGLPTSDKSIHGFGNIRLPGLPHPTHGRHHHHGHHNNQQYKKNSASLKAVENNTKKTAELLNDAAHQALADKIRGQAHQATSRSDRKEAIKLANAANDQHNNNQPPSPTHHHGNNHHHHHGGNHHHHHHGGNHEHHHAQHHTPPDHHKSDMKTQHEMLKSLKGIEHSLAHQPKPVVNIYNKAIGCKIHTKKTGGHKRTR